MPLPPLRGHHPARALLARAVVENDLAQSILLHGPPGIGKERFGLWLAQLLVCDTPAAEGPCGACLSCRLAGRLEHPDVHWFFPLPRPEGVAAERLREKLEEARAAELQLRRENPHHLPAHERAPAHFLASILTLQQLAAVRPAMGRRKVFVVGDAELMVPQESSPEAANAFLKLLEEPPADTTLILTSSSPGALLPTIRSRVLPVRLTPLPAEEVRAFLVATGTADDAAASVAPLAQGAIGRALRLAPAGEKPGPLEAQRQAGREMLLAALADSAAARFAIATRQAPRGGRTEKFLGELDALGGWLRDLMAVATGAEEQVVNTDGLEVLRRAAERYAIHPLGVTRALVRLAEAREMATGNVNPQLILAELLSGLQFSLRPDAGSRRAG